MKADAIQGYRLLHPIFRGGMTDLYVARDKGGQRVVIRFLKQTFARDRSIRKRFLHSAEILSLLDHPSIIRLIDTGKLEDTPYIIIEYVNGHTLRDLLLKRDTSFIDLRLVLLRQLAVALHYIHHSGFLHLDLKPENILVERGTSQLYVIDFDLSVKKGKAPIRLHECAGTPSYVAPEVMVQHQADERADIFSFGVIAYEMWTGHKPFEYNTIDESRNAQINPSVVPHPMKRFASDAPAFLESIILKSLAKDPIARYPSMSLVLKAIDSQR